MFHADLTWKGCLLKAAAGPKPICLLLLKMPSVEAARNRAIPEAAQGGQPQAPTPMQAVPLSMAARLVAMKLQLLQPTSPPEVQQCSQV